jgi:protein involved in polysaccharide export with SLBB domain
MKRIVFGFLGHWGLVLGMMLTGLYLSGCSSGGSKFTELPGVGTTARGGSTSPGQSAPSASAHAPAGVYDMIQPGDYLIFSFSDLPYVQPPIADRVKEDGTITLLQNQSFVAAGKSRGALEKEIRARYVPAFFVSMTVNVLPDRQSQFYTVRGEVKAPGRQVYLSRTTTLKAIGSAGDFTDFAKKSDVQLTRADGTIFHINAKKALKDPRLDLEVFPGDVIYVPRRVNPFSS